MKKSNNYYLDKLLKSTKGKVAIFIDAANLEKSVQDMWVDPRDVSDKFKSMLPDDLCWRVDYNTLKKFFDKKFDLVQISFYTAHFGTDGHNGFLAKMKKGFGYRLVTKDIKTFFDDGSGEELIKCPNCGKSFQNSGKFQRKANFDVEIAVDAIYNLPDYDTIILFSGDSDFAYLLRFLRHKEKKTILFSRKGHVAKELFPESDNYFDIVDFRNIFLRIVQKAKNPA